MVRASVIAAGAVLINDYERNIAEAVYGAEIAFTYKLQGKIDCAGNMTCGKLLVSPQINRNSIGIIDEIRCLS